MKRIICFLLLSFTLTFSASAQLTGYYGKKYIVHADLSSSALLRGMDIGIEWAALRTISFTLDASIYNKSNYDEQLLDNRYGDYSSDYHTASIHSRNIVFGIRAYSIGAYNAPKGSFTYLQYGMGLADIHGYNRYDETLYYGGQTFSSSSLHELTAKNVPVWYLEYGAGTQYVFVGKFTLETSFGLTYSGYDAKGNGSKIKLIADKYGANFIRFSDVIESPWGCSMHIKVGYLF